jgi:uncharacterized protein involved in outer membrane biogenesis
VKLFSSRWRTWAALAAVVIILFVLRPGASHLKSRIASSISAALGRSVEIGSVHIRLLPRPGFDLENLVVYDAPAFGSEPLLRAPEVTAALRLTSLMRGRLEIARLDLTEPSLNLVHRDGGRWNLEALLERTAHAPLAPTAKAKSEPRPAFPYIQVSSGRINFKFGQEKKPYALTNADFSLWQDSENSWGIRLKAQPFRSDLNLSDTGLLRVNGTWQRAETLRETPLQFAIEWDRPQLGQLTKFLTGADKGWRGTVLLDATLAGTPAQLQITSDASIRDFRRYDILSGQAVGLAAHCDGQYSSVDRMLHQVSCRAPVGLGSITLAGQLGLPGSHNFELLLAAENVPASAMAALAQRAKKNLPEDLVAAGTVAGSFSLRQNAASSAAPQFEGRGELTNVRLASAGNKAEFGAATLPFLLTSRVVTGSRRGNAPPAGSRLEFGPIALGGKSTPATATGWMSRTGYAISFAGETDIAHALHIAHLFGVPALSTTAEGAADVDLQIAGSWAGWSANSPSPYLQSQVTGSARLKNVRVAIRGANRPIEISAADLQFSPDQVKVSRITLNAAHTVWTGTLDMPRGCGTPSACVIHFNLNANEASLSDLRQWAEPAQADRPWYSVLSSAGKSSLSFLANLRATGRLTANRFSVQRLLATHVSANVSLDAGKLKVSSLRGELLGGTHLGEWQADFTRKPPVYSGAGTLHEVSMGLVADLMNDSWIAGVADGKYQLTASGLSAEDFWGSADSTVHFEIRDGSLPHLSLANNADPMKITSFNGLAHLREGVVEINDAALDSPAGTFQVSGTASLSRDLDFKLSPVAPANSAPSPARAYTITGTLANPLAVLVPSPETQAQLKP